MIKLYVYTMKDGVFSHELQGNYAAVINNIKQDEDFSLTPPPDYDHVWRWIDGKWVELLPINNPDILYGGEYIWNEQQNQWVECPELLAYKHLESQATIWEGIKAERLKQTTSGVYVPSVDKVFHTDDVSVIQYNNIGNMIALGIFEPIQWKVMDNTWITMTEEVFKDLQIAMVQNTNRIYQVAEVHKANMMELDNPEDYDYSEGW